MNHGGLGCLERGRLFLPSDLLKPLSITHRTRLFGMYYPSKYPHTTIQHDFMITPIPHRLWPKIGRYIIRVQHDPGTIQLVSQCLAANNVSILLAEVTRSGHRYDTWNLTVSFDFLPANDDLEFLPKETVYKETRDQINKIKKVMLTECGEALFRDKRDQHLKDPIHEIPHTALSYFYHQSKERTKLNSDEAWLFKPFNLIYNEYLGAIHSGDEEEFDAILEYIFNRTKQSGPWYVSASTDIQDMNIRVAIIPQPLERSFFEATYDYTRAGGPDSSRGLLAYLLEELPSDYNIWRLVNHTKISTPEREKGHLVFLIEDMGSSSRQHKDAIERARNIFGSIKEKSLPCNLDHLQAVKSEVKRLYPALIRDRLIRAQAKERKYDFDVFISHTKTDVTDAEKIKVALDRAYLIPFMATKEIPSGTAFSEEIRKNLVDSMEMCILVTPSIKKSEWVTTEWGAAWALGRTIVPILLKTSVDDLPDRLKDIEYRHFHELDRYVDEVAIRRDRLYERPDSGD
jgi:hypothetical protein